MEYLVRVILRFVTEIYVVGEVFVMRMMIVGRNNCLVSVYARQIDSEKHV